MTTWNNTFLKSCLHVGPMSVYDVFSELMASQNSMEWGMPRYSVNRNDKKIVTKFAWK
jgi:hypothetical protein